MPLFELIKQYISFYFSAKRKKGHGIHSPFVFELVSQVFVKKTDQCLIKDIEERRKYLIKNNNSIQVHDFGSGSNKDNEKVRQISNIAKYSLKPKKQAQLLFRIIEHYKYANILEIGTSLGITSTYLSKANPSAKIITLEGCPNIAEHAKETFVACNANNIELQCGDFSQTLISALDRLKKVDFVFFDGNHTKEATLKYFNACLPYIHNDSMFIFDDIFLSHEMIEAWGEIRTHKTVKASIDLFHMGIVVFRKEMTLEHYKIRF